MRYQGRITTWKDDKGFGFIAPNGGGEAVFAHISSFSNRRRRPVGNEIVSYELKPGDNGRLQATAIAFVGEAAPAIRSAGRSSLPPLFALGFVALLGAAALAGRLPKTVVLAYLAASIIAFLAYALDKSKAQHGQWRTQESTLHLLALFGGWPGALAAQRLLRHKSAKPAFLRIFWFTVALNCGALGWLFSPAGTRFLSPWH